MHKDAKVSEHCTATVAFCQRMKYEYSVLLMPRISEKTRARASGRQSLTQLLIIPLGLFIDSQCLPLYYEQSISIQTCFSNTQAPTHHQRPTSHLGDGEGGPGLLEVALLTLEPALVTGLHLQHVQLAAGHGTGEQHVAATLITVSGGGQQLVGVVGLALLLHLSHFHHGHLGDLAVLEATLGLGLACGGGGMRRGEYSRKKSDV